MSGTETRMSSQQKSLRTLVHDWFGAAGNLQVTRLERSCGMPWRAVRVEMQRSSGPFAIVFFRHDDASWCVYPPPALRPTMNWLRNAA
jgi:hypothetical protein